MDDERPAVRRPGAAPAARRPEAPKPARPRTDDRRQSGKLTVTRPLDDGEGARARSLAALKRSREKDKRSHMGGQPQVKQVRDVTVPEAITLPELAHRIADRDPCLVKALFKMDMPCN